MILFQEFIILVRQVLNIFKTISLAVAKWTTSDVQEFLKYIHISDDFHFKKSSSKQSISPIPTILTFYEKYKNEVTDNDLNGQALIILDINYMTNTMAIKEEHAHVLKTHIDDLLQTQGIIKITITLSNHLVFKGFPFFVICNKLVYYQQVQYLQYKHLQQGAKNKNENIDQQFPFQQLPDIQRVANLLVNSTVFSKHFLVDKFEEDDMLDYYNALSIPSSGTNDLSRVLPESIFQNSLKTIQPSFENIKFPLNIRFIVSNIELQASFKQLECPFVFGNEIQHLTQLYTGLGKNC